MYKGHITYFKEQWEKYLWLLLEVVVVVAFVIQKD